MPLSAEQLQRYRLGLLDALLREPANVIVAVDLGGDMASVIAMGDATGLAGLQSCIAQSLAADEEAARQEDMPPGGGH